jgi:hypothetical protein
MAQKPQPKRHRSPGERSPRNPFACEGWGRFIMRSVEADAMARAAAARRVTASGDTLH